MSNPATTTDANQSPAIESDQAESVRAQVLRRSREWVCSFNAGDVDAMVDGYHPDARMIAKPMGTFEGRAAIDGFWRPFVAGGASDLVYENVRIVVAGPDLAYLSADWHMNVGRGTITKEAWARGADGDWRLIEDHFEIAEQYSTPEASS